MKHFYCSKSTIAKIPPLIVPQPSSCKNLRASLLEDTLGHASIHWVRSQLPFIPFAAVQQQGCIFLFPARSLAKFCYIDRFVSARAKNSFSPGATLHQHHDGGGKHLPSVEERQLHYFHHAELGHLCKKVRTWFAKAGETSFYGRRLTNSTPLPQVAPKTQRWSCEKSNVSGLVCLLSICSQKRLRLVTVLRRLCMCDLVYAPRSHRRTETSFLRQLCWWARRLN